MNCLVKSLVAATAFAGALAGCATYDSGYASYGYGYPQTYYYGYDYGPYYGSYYYPYGYYASPPVVGFDFNYSDRGHRRRDGHAHNGQWHNGRWNGQAWSGQSHAPVTSYRGNQTARTPRFAQGSGASRDGSQSQARVNARGMSRSSREAARAEQHG